MATTAYGVNHPLAVKQWARKLYTDALKQTYISKFIGSGSSALIQKRTELNKDAGDRVTVGLRMQLSGAGVEGDATLEGNEEALTTYTDNLLINQLRHAVRSDGKMSEQRIPFSVREEAKTGLADWFADKMDTSFFNHIAGNTNAATGPLTGHNATVAATSTRILYGDGTHVSDASLTASASNDFTVTLIDKAIANIKTASPTIRPIKIKGSEYYVGFLHPYQVYSLRTTATAATVQWYDVQKAKLQGDGSDENPIFSGALGIYNGVILHETTRLPAMDAGGDKTRRAVICGAQAASIAFGQDFGAGEASWKEKFFDYDNQLGVSGGLIWGLKKMVFNSTDFGTYIIATRAVAPA